MRISTIIQLVFLLLTSVIVYHRWFTTGVFIHGDYHYYFPEYYLDYLNPSLWQASNGFGSVILTPWRIPHDYLFGLFISQGFRPEVADKFLLIWPTIIAQVSAGYIFSWTITKGKSATACVFGSLVYTYYSYFITINSQGHFLLTLGASIGLIAISLIIQTLDRHSTIKIIFAGIFLVLSMVADLRSFILTVFQICILFLASLQELARHKKNLAINILFLSAIVLFVPAYFLVPLISVHGGEQILARSLFGNSFWTLIPALTGMHPFWQPVNLLWFKAQPVSWPFFTLPVVSLAVLAFFPRNKIKIFLTLILICGIFLAKQISPPFGDVYKWLFVTVPGFSAFRESTKFYSVVATGYTGVIALLMVELEKLIRDRKRCKYLYFVPIIALTVYILTTILPILTGSIGNLYIPSNIDDDYLVIRELISNDPETFRTLMVPTGGKRNFQTYTHPTVEFMEEVANLQMLEKLYGIKTDQNLGLEHFFTSNLTKHLLSEHVIKYIIVPKREEHEDIFKDFPQNREYYVANLDKVSYLQKISDPRVDDVDIYLNSGYRPRFALISTQGFNVPLKDSGLQVPYLHNFSYDYRLIDPRQDYFLDFRDSFHKDWEVLFGETRSHDDTKAFKHVKTSIGLNRYVIPGSQLAKNSKVHIYFGTQDYLIKGIKISAYAILGAIVVVFAIYFSRKSRRLFKYWN